jgi:transcriptional regulator with XRE-family HTH domain
MLDPAMTLTEYIRAHFGGSQRSFAKSVGIDPGQLSRYLKLERGEPGGSKPSADSLAKIEKVTGPRFGAAYWSKIDPIDRNAKLTRHPQHRLRTPVPDPA